MRRERKSVEVLPGLHVVPLGPDEGPTDADVWRDFVARRHPTGLISAEMAAMALLEYRGPALGFERHVTALLDGGLITEAVASDMLSVAKDALAGLRSWLPPSDAGALFGIDRSGPTRFDMPTQPRSLLTRLSDAWRGMRDGWKGAL